MGAYLTMRSVKAWSMAYFDSEVSRARMNWRDLFFEVRKAVW